MSRTGLVILTAYLVLIGALAGGMFAARSRILAQMDPEGSRQEWEQWRQEAARQSSGEGPVTRRTPKAVEAPTILLLRDHFGACLTLTLVISTVLFATFALMIRGVLFGPKLQLHQDAESPTP